MKFVEIIHAGASVTQMKYALLVYVDESTHQAGSIHDPNMYADSEPTASDRCRILAQHMLMPATSATTLHLRAGMTTLMPGAATNASLQLAASFVIECAHFDDAADWAATFLCNSPAAVEIRPMAPEVVENAPRAASV